MNFQAHQAYLPHMHCLGGGALVECGVREVAGELHHLQPLIYRSSTAIIIFYGFLSNVDELANRLDVEVPSGFSFGRAKSRLYSRGLHGEAAEALLELYLNTHANDLLIMLSELQVRLLAVSAVSWLVHVYVSA